MTPLLFCESLINNSDMKKPDLEKLSNEELNDILEAKGLAPVVEDDDDRVIAISILTQL